MAADFESTTLILLVVLTIACVMQVIFLGLLLMYMKRVAATLGGTREPVAPPRLPPAPGPAPVPEPAPGATGRTGGTGRTVEIPAPAPAPAIEILRDSPDIQGSIHRLCEKYRLSDFILATLDGLVVVSMYPGSAEEAARFSDLHRRKKKPDSPGVTFLEISHHGEAMLAILRADHPLSPGEEKGIGEDAERILNWWL